MKRLACLLLVVLCAAPAWAQLGPRPAFSAMGVYQRYTLGDTTLAQASIPLTVTLPVGRSFSASLSAQVANVTADLGTTDGLDDVTESFWGLTDVQAVLSYVVEIGQARIVASLRAGLPTGKREMTTPEFNTVRLLSQTFYEFNVPSFGQGFSVSPGFTAAFPVTEDVVVGLGASYNVRGSYTPVAGGVGDYNPGEEILLIGGADYRLSPATALSLDLTYTIYGTDTIGGSAGDFEAGNKLTGALQLRQLFGFHELRVAARYRDPSKSDLIQPDGTSFEVQTIPRHADLLATFRLRASRTLSTTFRAQVRTYDTVTYLGRELYAPQTVVELGLAPTYQVTPQFAVRSLANYTTGTFSGIEAGLGTVVTF